MYHFYFIFAITDITRLPICHLSCLQNCIVLELILLANPIQQVCKIKKKLKSKEVHIICFRKCLLIVLCYGIQTKNVFMNRKKILLSSTQFLYTEKKLLKHCNRKKCWSADIVLKSSWDIILWPTSFPSKPRKKYKNRDWLVV